MVMLMLPILQLKEKITALQISILKLDFNSAYAKQLKNTIVAEQEKDKEEKLKEQQQAINNSIVIKYSIDENGYITGANYPNGSSIPVKLGQTINLVGNVSSKSQQRVLFDSTIMGGRS